MKKSEILLVGVIIFIFAIVILFLLAGNREKKNNEAELGDKRDIQSVTISEGTGSEEGISQNSELELNLENAKLVNDNTKLNTSREMSETKTIDGLEISNVQLTSKDNVSVLLATVTNKTNETKGDFAVKLTIFDKERNTITEAHGYISKVEAGKTTQLNISKTFDFANAYDYEIEKE